MKILNMFGIATEHYASGQLKSIECKLTLPDAVSKLMVIDPQYMAIMLFTLLAIS